MLYVNAVYEMMFTATENLTILIHNDDCAAEDCSNFSLSNRI
jgi:hypothetical protein